MRQPAAWETDNQSRLIDTMLASNARVFRWSNFPYDGGAYVIYGVDDEVLHVGEGGDLKQRIYQNHLMGDQEGNLRKKLVRLGKCKTMEETKDWIRDHCRVQFLTEEELEPLGMTKLKIRWDLHARRCAPCRFHLRFGIGMKLSGCLNDTLE